MDINLKINERNENSDIHIHVHTKIKYHIHIPIKHYCPVRTQVSNQIDDHINNNAWTQVHWKIYFEVNSRIVTLIAQHIQHRVGSYASQDVDKDLQSESYTWKDYVK